MRKAARLVLTASLSVVALSACTLNTQPPPPAATVTVTPNPVVLPPPPPGPSTTYVSPGATTVVTPRAY